MTKVDITFKVEFTLVVCSKVYNNRFKDNCVNVVDIDEILNYEKFSLLGLRSEGFINKQNNFLTKWYKDVTLKNYDEKFIRSQYSLEYLFDRIEHSKNVKDIKREIIDELLDNESFLQYINISEKEIGGITIGSVEIPARKITPLAMLFEEYTERNGRLRYGRWDVIPKVIDYEIEYK